MKNITTPLSNFDSVATLIIKKGFTDLERDFDSGLQSLRCFINKRIHHLMDSAFFSRYTIKNIFVKIVDFYISPSLSWSKFNFCVQSIIVIKSIRKIFSSYIWIVNILDGVLRFPILFIILLSFFYILYKDLLFKSFFIGKLLGFFY